MIPSPLREPESQLPSNLLLQRAIDLLVENKAAECVNLLNSALKQNPNDLNGLMLLNLIYDCAANGGRLPEKISLPQLTLNRTQDLTIKYPEKITTFACPQQIRKTQCKTPATISTIRRALLVPPHSSLILEEDLITDSVPIAPHRDITFKLALDSLPPRLLELPPIDLPGEYFPICGLWSNFFFHWMMDYIPRLLLAEECGYSGKYLVRSKPRFIRESLSLLGIDQNRITELEPSVPLTIEKAIVSTPFPACTFFEDPWPLILLRECILSAAKIEPNPNANARIFLSRRGPARTVDNQEVLERILAPYGFKTVYAEDLSLLDQIILFSGCSALITPHGAGMVHSLWMPTNSLVLEMFPPRYVNPCFLGTARILKQRYYMIPTYQNNPDFPAESPVTAFCEPIVQILEREL